MRLRAYPARWVASFFRLKIEAAESCGDEMYARQLGTLYLELEAHMERMINSEDIGL